MASQHIASTQPSTPFDRIPTEIWATIAQALPANSLSSFVLSSRKFYISANQDLYRTFYYYGTRYHYVGGARVFPNVHDSCFGIHRAQSWLAQPDSSVPINHLEALLKTITTNLTLQSHMIGASFGWDDTPTAQDNLVAKKCVDYLQSRLGLLHLALPDFDTKFAITVNVTFLEIVYPDEKLLTDEFEPSQYDIEVHQSLRDRLYSIFCIPTLRDLSIRNVRSWQAFDPPTPDDNSAIGISNVISLSLPNTVPLSRDLQEILTWPKALSKIYHENAPGDNNFFQTYGTEQLASSEVFIKGLRSQRHTIEELFYNNREDCCGNDETTFGMALREFISLKRLAVPIDTLVADGEDKKPLRETLPPNLEEAWIQISSEYIYDHKECSILKEDLRGIAMTKKQCCPSLRRFVLWMANARYDMDRDEYPAEERRMLSELDLVSTFQNVGIRLDLTIGQAHKFGS